MKLVEKSNNQIVFTSEINESLINAIRRSVSEIPILAVDEVEILKNDSAVYDETIAHRIGLIPLKMEKGIDDKTEINLKLATNREGKVFSGELKGKVKVVYDKIPITNLSKGQEIEIVAKAKLGKGSEHSKYSPGTIFYREVCEIVMDKEFLDEVRRICPKNEIKEKGDKIIVIDDRKKGVADVCEGMCDTNNKKAEVNYKNELIITIESFGQLEVKDIFHEAIREFGKELNNVAKKIEKA